MSRLVLAKLAATTLLLGVLSGCAGLAPKPVSPPPSTGQQSLASEKQAKQRVDFEVRQRALAEEAEARGQWAQAAWAWEALLALQPGEQAIATRLQGALKAADSLATLRAQQARLALQLGDFDSARDLYLRALRAAPTHADAIDGLRALEQERTIAQLRTLPTRTAARPSKPPPAEVEHAALLAAQGELDAGIRLLQPLTTGRQANPAARRSMSELLMLQALAQRAADPTLALASLRRSLQMDSRNTRAQTLLREWRKAPVAASVGAANSP